ncbi:MAG: glucosidase [Candidatus Dormiibacterota bacterium]
MPRATADGNGMGMDDAERARLIEDAPAWRRWGPYLSERAWGTVREDYSANGDAWDYLPHDHARSRAYRWSEDGLGGLCDEHQLLCFAFAFWNGADPILKERIFGLTGPQGNHGEDAKEYWWYVDSTPTHSWMRWRYLYPQQPYPYDELVEENARRTPFDPEYELADTGVLDAGFWDITVDYAKESPDDFVMELRARNAGGAAASLHVLPTLWFRNTWAWGITDTVPAMRWDVNRIVADHTVIGRFHLSGDGDPQPLFCDNESNATRLWGSSSRSAFPKDAINDHIVNGTADVNPAQTGTKAALHYVLRVDAGAVATVRLRFGQRDAGASRDVTGEVLQVRAAEADAFYASVLKGALTTDEQLVVRSALGAMLWSKQFYHYNVARWLDGDPAEPPPPSQRLDGRNAGWRHVDNADVISMPDKWEYPWFAAWDLGFQCVALAHVDPAFAKEQLILLCREWYMHANGQLPAYEWSFDDVNPPVHAWAALRVFEIDGATDHAFLARVFHKLLINFTWWVNREDAEGNNIFEGGFLGLDNIGAFDRSALIPRGGHLEQSDGTAWMAMYSLNLLEMALILAAHDRTYEDVATKFFEHFTAIATAMNEQGLWDNEAGFYYDSLHLADGTRIPIQARSIVGLIPLCASTTLGHDTLQLLPDFAERLRLFIKLKPRFAAAVSLAMEPDERENRLLAIVDPDRLRRILTYLVDESEFLSDHGLRGLSKYHAEHPLDINIDGTVARLDYEPAESTSRLFGGNSNWRGPVWFPVNHLIIEALRMYHRFLGDGWTVEYPSGSGRQAHLGAIADDIAARLAAIFLEDAQGIRPVVAGTALYRRPDLAGLIPFHEYFHADNGRGLGASHQTGWTGLVADLLLRRTRPRDRYDIASIADL